MNKYERSQSCQFRRCALLYNNIDDGPNCGEDKQCGWGSRGLSPTELVPQIFIVCYFFLGGGLNVKDRGKHVQCQL